MVHFRYAGGMAERDSAFWLRVLRDGGAAPAADAAEAALTALSDLAAPSTLAAPSKRPTVTLARVQFARLGRACSQDVLARSPTAHDVPGLEHSAFFRTDIVARVAWLVSLPRVFEPEELVSLFTTLYRTGSDREQASVLRALPHLPEPDRYVALAREASRTNDVWVYSALASQSSFPARYLPDDAFAQLILKSMFLGVSVESIFDWQARVTPELSRMVADYAAERRAAGRVVPSDAALFSSPSSSLPSSRG